MQRDDIKSFDETLQGMQSYLKEKLLEDGKDDEDYLKRLEHYDTLKELLDKKDYEGAKQHIELGLAQFKQIFFTARYFALLVDLKKNLMYEDADDLSRRFQKLAAAIISNDQGRLSSALQQGCLGIINTPAPQLASSGISQGSLPLDIAMKQNNKNAFNFLYAKGAVGSDNNQVFHFAAENGLFKIVAALKNNGKIQDIDVQNDKGETALWLAIKNNETLQVQQLLNMGADPNIKPKGKASCLSWAIHHGNFALVSALLKAEVPVKVKDSDYIRAKAKRNTQEGGKIFNILYQGVKKPLKENKRKIIEQTGQDRFFYNAFSGNEMQKNKLYQLALVNPTDAIIRQVYVAEDQIKEKIHNSLSNFLTPHSILEPMLKIVALGAVGIRGVNENEAKPTKALKTIIDDKNKHLMNLTLSASEGTSGLYNWGNSVYVARVKHYDYSATAFHEWKHFTDKEVFGNTDMPLSGKDQKIYNEIVKKVREDMKQFPEDNKTLMEIKKSFVDVFSAYKSAEVNAELLARVPEVLGALGMEKGYKWLQDNTPTLLSFYEKNYNKYLEAHLEKLQKKYGQNQIIDMVNSPEVPHKRMTK